MCVVIMSFQLWSTHHSGGGGGESSGLDAIYPTTNCWPEDPSGEGGDWKGGVSGRDMI